MKRWWRERLAIAVVGLISTCAASAAQVSVFFAPSAADPAVTQFNNNHYAVVDSAIANRGRLVLFLPGTGATPFLYQAFPQNAASLGFHALSLMYPNGAAINSLCAINSPLDPDAAGNARLEVIDGTNRVSFLTVDRTNCIENRLLKALQYLQANYPTRGWGQYYSNSAVLWNKVIVSGHSQGGGMAAMLAKTRAVDRCVIFTDMDWWVAGNRPYNWMTNAPLTSVENWFLFAHERDQFLDFTQMGTVAGALDLTRYGAYLRVETSAAPAYSNRHFLATNLDPSTNQPTSYHGCPVVDAATPMQADGVTPGFKSVWDYMLLHATPSVAIESASTNLAVMFSPGSLQQSTNLIDWGATASTNSPLLLPKTNLTDRRFFKLVP